MTKLFSKSIALLGLVSAITLCSFAPAVSAKESSVSATVSSSTSSPEDTLNQFLSAYIKQDVELASSLSKDTRYESVTEEKNGLSDSFKDETQLLSEFKVLETINKDSNSALIKSHLSYKSGEILERAFEVKKIDDNWTVILSDTIPNKEYFKQIKQSKEKNPGKKIFKNEVPTNFNSTSIDVPAVTGRAAAIATWNYSFSYDSLSNTKYSSTMNTTAKVLLNYRQYGFGTPSFTYAIVKKSSLGDTSYASFSVTASNPTGAAKQYTLSTGARSGVSLKVTFGGPFSTNPSTTTTSYGEIYSQ